MTANHELFQSQPTDKSKRRNITYGRFYQIGQLVSNGVTRNASMAIHFNFINCNYLCLYLENVITTVGCIYLKICDAIYKFG